MGMGPAGRLLPLATLLLAAASPTLGGDPNELSRWQKVYQSLTEEQLDSIRREGLEAATSHPNTSIVPEQLHIAYAGQTAEGYPSGMSVAWWTPGLAPNPQVKFGTQANSLTSVVKAVPNKYYKDGNTYKASLLGLSPDTKYYYSCGSTGHWSPVHSFTTAPNTNRPHKFSLFGDWGTLKDGHAIATWDRLKAIQDEVDYFWHVGDISYADDAFLHHFDHFYYERTWNEWFNWVEGLTSNKAYMTLPGNHEAECHSPSCILHFHSQGHVLNNFTAYNHRFDMPSEVSGGVMNMWYSFNYGLVHFINIDTETDYPDAPMQEKNRHQHEFPAGHFGANIMSQIEWIERDLQKAVSERHIRPWIIVGGHRPLDYSQNARLGMMDYLEGLLHKYKVDLVVAGHVHSYSRSYPVYNGTVHRSYDNPPYPAYLVVGGAGCDEMKLTPKNEPPTPYPDWGAKFVTNYYTTGIMTVHNSSLLEFELLESQSGTTVDHFTLYKERN